MRHPDEPDVAEVLARLKYVHGATSDRDLARKLDVPASTVASWRQRGSIPYAYCVSFALNRGGGLDWLILGLERDAAGDLERLDAHATGLALQMMNTSLLFLDEGLDPDILGGVFNKLQKSLIETIDQAVAAGRTREEAVDALKKGVKDVSREVLSEAFRRQELRSNKS